MKLEDVPLRRVNVGGIGIAYREWGVGEPLVLVHGLGTSSALWIHQAEPFGRRFRVIAVDLRGFGASDRPEGGVAYHVDAFVDDLLGLAEALELPPAHWLGTSMGGFMVQTLALRAPERVRSAVLAHTAARLRIPADVLAIRLEGLRASTMEDYGRLVAAQALAAGEASPLFPWIAGMIAANDRESYAAVLSEGLRDFDVSERLAELRHPVLVVVGNRDRVLPPEAGLEVAERISGAALARLPESGHLGYAEEPDRFNAHVLEFLAALR